MEEKKMVGIQISKELNDKVYEAIESAKSTGKLKKGVNEVTKAIEKEKAKLVAIAKDVTPPEIVMHLPLLAEERNIIAVEVSSREELGASAGIEVPTVAVAITEAGDAKALIEEIIAEIKRSK
jgi:large subunit ribosomal protein L7Ae